MRSFLLLNWRLFLHLSTVPLCRLVHVALSAGGLCVFVQGQLQVCVTLDGARKAEMAFEFEIENRVHLVESDETGEVIGRAEYKTLQNCYLVRYKAGDGRMVESWWGEDALVAA